VSRGVEMPDQPFEVDEQNALRFVGNSLVRFMLEEGRKSRAFDLQRLFSLPGVSADERAQLLQLLGYSLHGYEESNAVTNELFDRAKAKAEREGFR